MFERRPNTMLQHHPFVHSPRPHSRVFQNTKNGVFGGEGVALELDDGLGAAPQQQAGNVIDHQVRVRAVRVRGVALVVRADDRALHQHHITATVNETADGSFDVWLRDDAVGAPCDATQTRPTAR